MPRITIEQDKLWKWNFYFPTDLKKQLFVKLTEIGLKGKQASAFFRVAAIMFIEGKLDNVITAEEITKQIYITPNEKESKL